MGKHASHEIHGNSVAAFHAEDIAGRRELVLSCFIDAGQPLTDRQCMRLLGFHDMNSVRPAITTMVAQGHLQQVGNVKCPVTNRTVRTCAPAKAVSP